MMPRTQCSQDSGRSSRVAVCVNNIVSSARTGAPSGLYLKTEHAGARRCTLQTRESAQQLAGCRQAHPYPAARRQLQRPAPQRTRQTVVGWWSDGLPGPPSAFQPGLSRGLAGHSGHAGPRAEGAPIAVQELYRCGGIRPATPPQASVSGVVSNLALLASCPVTRLPWLLAPAARLPRFSSSQEHQRHLANFLLPSQLLLSPLPPTTLHLSAFMRAGV
jgi:hypothetical protein